MAYLTVSVRETLSNAFSLTGIVSDIFIWLESPGDFVHNGAKDFLQKHPKTRLEALHFEDSLRVTAGHLPLTLL